MYEWNPITASVIMYVINNGNSDSPLLNIKIAMIGVKFGGCGKNLLATIAKIKNRLIGFNI